MSYFFELVLTTDRWPHASSSIPGLHSVDPGLDMPQWRWRHPRSPTVARSFRSHGLGDSVINGLNWGIERVWIAKSQQINHLLCLFAKPSFTPEVEYKGTWTWNLKILEQIKSGLACTSSTKSWTNAITAHVRNVYTCEIVLGSCAALINNTGPKMKHVTNILNVQPWGGKEQLVGCLATHKLRFQFGTTILRLCLVFQPGSHHIHWLLKSQPY